MAPNSTQESSAGPSGSQQPQSPLYWSRLPSIKILRPPKGRFSPQVDERCFTYCSQSIRGRIEQSEPWCRTFCIRRVFQHEVRRTLEFHETNQQVHHGSQASGDSAAEAKFPLPPEGQNLPGLFGTLAGSSHTTGASEESEENGTWASVAGTKHPEEVRHWKEGWYIWTSKSRWGAQEKIDLMMCDLERQAEWQRYKEKANQEWADNEKREMQKTSVSASDLVTEHDVEKKHDAEPKSSSVSATLDHVHETPSIVSPPFPDASAQALLLPIPPPLPPLTTPIRNLLAPAGKVLNLTSESIHSGSQLKFAQRVWEKAGTNEPFVLARNVCRKMWKTWKEGGEGNQEGKDS